MHVEVGVPNMHVFNIIGNYHQPYLIRTTCRLILDEHSCTPHL